MMKILVINPNSTRSMTDALIPLLKQIQRPDIGVTYFTAPSGVASINNEQDAAQSSEHCIAEFQRRPDLLDNHDAFLVACYSKHPLVEALKQNADVKQLKKPVIGIFEASVVRSLSSLPEQAKFGIISTGKVWEQLLSTAVEGLPSLDGLGEAEARFAGVQTTGLNATELHDAPQGVVTRKIKEATHRLLKSGNVKVICMGCAGMVGLDQTIREACVESLGQQRGDSVEIVDGVAAGFRLLQEALALPAQARMSCFY